MKKFILSPCGTSLLTNSANQAEKGLLFAHANQKKKENIESAARFTLETLLERVSEKLENAKISQGKALSAELNGILTFYESTEFHPQDFHYLVSTDTWLGEETAKLIQRWLQRENYNVEVRRQKDLQTADLPSFQIALSDLVKELIYHYLNPYRDQGYHIVFNLTGGFKSVVGFLQSIANVLADETVYIFETSSQLLHIPRLPLTMDFSSVIRDYLEDFRQLALDLGDPSVQDIPETLLLTLDGKSILSAFGEMAWNQSKKSLYGERLWPAPTPNIQFSSQFKKDAKVLDADRLYNLNQRIDQLAQFLHSERNPGSLDFKQLKGNPMSPSTHEMDAWSDKDAKRLFGHYVDPTHKKKGFVLDRLACGLH
jgi:putative CRISPR-associated protein (TIGR02619 family)